MDRRRFMMAIGLSPVVMLTAKAVAKPKPIDPKAQYEKLVKYMQQKYVSQIHPEAMVVRADIVDGEIQIENIMPKDYFLVKPKVITMNQARVMFPKMKEMI